MLTFSQGNGVNDAAADSDDDDDGEDGWFDNDEKQAKISSPFQGFLCKPT